MRLQAALSTKEVFKENSQGDGVWLYPLRNVSPAPSTVSGPPMTLVGPPLNKPVRWNVRVDLELNSTQPPAWFFARFESGEVLELVDKGSLSGSRYYDRVYSGQVATNVSRPQRVQITEVAFDGRFRVLWQGRIAPLDVREDHLSFRMSESGVVAPMLRSMGMHPLEVRHNGGRILGAGWLFALLMMAGWWRRVSKQLDDDQAVG